MQRLSPGLRINSARDDPAAQISGLNQAVRNASGGVSVAQSADLPAFTRFFRHACQHPKKNFSPIP